MISRRSLLLGSVIGPVLAAACSPPKETTVPPSTGPGTTAPPRPFEDLEHLLRRATFGPTPGLRAEIRDLGAEAWLDGQLDPSSLDDSPCDALLADLTTPGLSPRALVDQFGDDRGLIVGELVMARWIRALHSRRQLHEVMTALWSDHFNVDIGTGQVIFLKGVEEREVMRTHALGRFADLLAADVASPAMLVYLDNASSRADGDHVPNENHARELLELHTMGVDGGYDEADVVEVARLLSGWTVDRRTGTMVFRDEWHTDRPVGGILGWTVGARRGREAGESFIEHLARHPRTARHVAARIVRRFVSDAPPPSLVESATQVYLDRDTAIAPVVRHVLSSAEFAGAAHAKTTTPFEFMAASARRLGGEVTGGTDPQARIQLSGALAAMGSAPYRWPSPDGPPDAGEPWINPGLMLARWNSVLALVAGGVGGTTLAWNDIEIPPSTDVTASLDTLAARLGVELDPATRTACLDLWGLAPGDPAPTPDPALSKMLCALMTVSPAAHRR